MFKSTKSEKFIQETIDHWQPYYEEELTKQDAIEIIDNVTGFFELLMSWDRRRKERELE